MDHGEPTKATQHERTVGLLLGHIGISIAGIGLQAGLFERLGQRGEPLSSSTLADSLGYAEHAVAVWCRAAYAFEFLDQDEAGRYRLAPFMDELLLDPLDVGYLGARIRFAHLGHHDNDAYVGFLRTGRSIPRSELNRELLDILADSTTADAAMIIDEVLPQAGTALTRLEAGGAILEIGAGTGGHLVRYATRFPGARIVALESDGPSIEIARRTVADSGLGRHVEIRHGDANRLSERESFDLVTMNLALHETGGPGEHLNVLQRARAALRPGGAAIVSELPYPDDDHAYRSDPVYRRLAGLMLHETLVGCSAITQQRLLRLFQDAGFARVRVADQSRPQRWVVIGEKLPASGLASAEITPFS